tara:strand:- start:1 stop:690 length:690 start_codon:yes stop_codon:yes gene_type:complete
MFNSNRLICLESNNGNIIWDFNYSLEKPSLLSGGKIIVNKNIIFAKMPNGSIAAIDTIVGEEVDYDFIADIEQKNILNYNYDIDIHLYEKYFSIFEEGNIYTYDLINEKFLLNYESILLSKSHKFINNALLVLNDQNSLISYNIKNKNIFWEINLNKKIDKDDSIVDAFIVNNDLLVFFSSGLVLQLNKFSGEIVYEFNSKNKKTKYVTMYKDYILFNKSNGTTSVYKQ